jgi:hypothetical protein
MVKMGENREDFLRRGEANFTLPKIPITILLIGRNRGKWPECGGRESDCTRRDRV